jgi:hypothetical protein
MRFRKLVPLIALALLGCGQERSAGGGLFFHAFFLPEQLETGSAPLFVHLSEGKIYASDRRGNRLQVLERPFQGPFQLVQSIDLGASPGESVRADFWGDGRPDLAVALRSGSEVLLFEDSDPSRPRRFAVGQAPQGLKVADLDGDGRLDLAVSNVGSDSLSILYSQGNGFSPAQNLSVGTQPVQLEIGDFSGDGRLDLASSNFGSASVTVYRQTSARSYALHQSLAVGQGAFGLLGRDLNGDGRTDLVVANELDGSLSRFLQRDGALQAGQRFPVGAKPDQLAWLDGFLLVSLEEESGVAVVGVQGQGDLSRLTLLPTRGGPVGLASADLDQDGLTDAVTANFFGQGLTWLRQVGPATNFRSTGLESKPQPR